MRFPTVAELFQGTATSSSITVNDPDLDAEVSDSIDLTLERTIAIGHWRATLFEDDVRDSIFSQTNIAVSPSITNVQNIDRVRSRGVELAFAAAPFGPMLSVNGNVAYVRTRIARESEQPDLRRQPLAACAGLARESAGDMATHTVVDGQRRRALFRTHV